MRRGSALLLAVTALVSACDGSSSAEREVTAPPPTRSQTPPTSLDSSPSSDPSETDGTETSPPTTESVATTVADTSLPPQIDDLGPALDSVPGVNSPGEIIELLDMVALFIPSDTDPNDANVSPPLPEDLEIIEAYARAMQALYHQVTMNPIPVEPSDAMAAAFLDGGAKYSANVFGPRNAAGHHLAFEANNDVLRPVVLADPRSDEEAFIFDCAISGSNYVNADGTLVDGQTPGTELAPTLVRLVRVEGDWIVDDIQDDERACR